MSVLSGLRIKTKTTNTSLLNIFYSSITENEALKLVKNYRVISEEKINIINHCRKLILYDIRNSELKRVLVNPMCAFDDAPF